MKLSYAILVCNELKEITTLLEHMENIIDDEDEIVIIFDNDGGTQEVKDYIESKKNSQIKVHYNSLNKDFAQQKNFMNSKCSGSYIINIDADEFLHENLLENIKELLTLNSKVDVYRVPRVNIVNGITDDYIRQVGWHMNDKGHINFPDYQMRIYRNSPSIKWVRPVHEMLSGYNHIANLPMEEEWSIYHIKDFERQKQQNEFYDTI